MLDCDDIERHLIDLIDGSISVDLRLEFEEHLNRCAECRAIVSEFRTFSMAPEKNEQLRVPDSLWRNVQTQINQWEDGKTSKGTSGRSIATVFSYTIRTVSAVAAVFVGISLGSIPEKSEANEDQALVEYYATGFSQVESLDSSAILFDLVEPEDGQ